MKLAISDQLRDEGNEADHVYFKTFLLSSDGYPPMRTEILRGAVSEVRDFMLFSIYGKYEAIIKEVEADNPRQAFKFVDGEYAANTLAKYGEMMKRRAKRKRWFL